MFSQSVIEQLGFYVYYLQDPRNGDVFYVGKGTGNRVFNHLDCAIDSDGKTEKLDRIRDIISSGLTVKHYVLHHGLSEKSAFEVEASILDFIGMDNLSNQQGGHYSSDYGIKTAEEINAMYNAETFKTDIPLILININKRYYREITENKLYDATRKSWVIGERKNQAKFVVATYRGLTREVYKIHEWFPVEIEGKTRWGFNGVLANEVLRNELMYKLISSFFSKGAVNPTKYLNC